MKAKEAGRIIWKTLFGGVPEMEKEQLDKYIKSNPSGSYTLLDVRQPHEYEQDHLPGAKLIPLPDLFSRWDELDKDKSVIAYCASGRRSMAAAEMLSGRGFGKVVSLRGGMNAWEGLGAEGPPERGMAIFKGDETAAAMLAVAYGLEKGLGQFYRALGEAGGAPEALDLYQRLAKMETAHEKKVLRLFTEANPTPEDEANLKTWEDSPILEGGFDKEKFLAEYRQREMKPEGILDLAMMIEAQAQDLYLRMAHAAEDPEARDILYSIADDEKDHLAALARLWDQLAA